MLFRGYVSTMRVRRTIGLGLSVALCWSLLAVCASRPSTYTDFRTTAGQAAQATLSAVRTAAVSGRAALAGRMLDPYLATVLRNATDAVAGAQQKLATQEPPATRGRGAAEALRNDLAPLLVRAGQGIGDLAAARSAGDRAGQRAAVDELDRLGEQLADFVERRT
jgi:hypothetical protein